MTRVSDKVALITGAARGQGRSHAIRLAEEGADIIAVDICADIAEVGVPMGTAAELAETKEAVEALGRRAYVAEVDVRSREALAAAVRDGVEAVGGGGLDIAVANAGICTLQHWHDVSPEVWQATLDINLTGAWNTCSAAAPLIVERGGGSIILISSAAGRKGMAFLLPYTVSKHGIVGLMRGLSNELAEQRVRVNSIHPGGVDTPMNLKAGVMQEMIEERPHLAPLFQNTMSMPMMEPREISEAVLFLASDESRFVTGIELPVDAGATAV